MAQRIVIPGFRKIETSSGGESGTSNYNDLSNKPSINNVPLVGNLNTVDLKLTDATLTEEGVPAEAKTVGQKLEEQSTSLTSLSEQLGNHTIKSDVPENAVFTDTVYDDKKIQKRISDNGYGEVAGGKNLFDPKCLLNATYDEKTDTITVLNNVNKALDMVFKENTQYTFSAYIKQSNSSTNNRFSIIYTDGTTDTAFLYTQSTSEVYLSATSKNGKTISEVKWNQGDTGTATFRNFQIEEGIIATEYEPYIPSVKMLAEENEQQNTEAMDLKMLGWIVPKEMPVQNYVDSDGVFHQRVGRVDLGSLNWRAFDSTRFISNIKTAKSFDDSIKANAFCKIYKTVSKNNVVNINMSIGIDDVKNVWLRNDSYTDATAFKNAMNDKYLYYELETPITMTIDGNEKVVEVAEDVDTLKKETTVNLLNPTLQTTTQNGVTCTNNGDGTYTLNGTATKNVDFSFFNNLEKYQHLKNRTIKLVGCPKGGSSTTYRLVLQLQKDPWPGAYDSGEGSSVTVDNNDNWSCWIRIFEGATVSNLTFKPMITTNLDATYDDFVPYTGDTGKLNSDVASLLKRIETLESIVNKTDTTVTE